MQQKQPLLSRDEIGLIYAAGVLFWLPLYMADGYVRLIDAKTIFFYLLTVAAAGACLVHALAMRRACPAHSTLSKPDISLPALAGLCAVYLLNLLNAADPTLAFFGKNGRHNGTLMVLTCAACWCIIRYTVHGRQTLTLFHIMLAGTCAAGVLGCLNYFLIDPLNAYYLLDFDAARIFLSTIGNDNFFGALMAMGAALAAQLFLCAKKKSAQLVYGAATALLATALIPANSDAAWLGFCAALALIVCVQNLYWRQLARLCFAGAGFCAAAFLFGFGVRNLPVRDELDAISALIIHPLVSGALLLALLVLGLFLHRSIDSCTRVMRILVAAALVLALLLVLAANFTSLSLGPLHHLLRFGMTWGSGRGYVWGRLLSVYHDAFTPLQMLIGMGGDAVNALLNPRYTQDIIAINGLPYDSAHNIYVQQLLCGGALGLMCWLVFFGKRLYAGLRRTSPAAFALAAYCVQAFFSIDMPAVLAAAFVLAALTDPAPEQPAGPAPRRAGVCVGALGLFLFGAALTPSLL